MSFSVTTNLDEMKCWPLGGFAPGGYAKVCVSCHKEFPGDKRATLCLECAISAAKVMIVEKLKGAVASKSDQQEFIAAAAVYHGCTFSLPRPARHGHVLATISMTLKQDAMAIPPENQGFITSTGRFVNRVEAKLIAFKAGQIIRHSAGEHCPELYSEDLW